MAKSATLTVGATLNLIGEVGPSRYASIWSWTVTIIEEREKAIKVTAEGAGRRFAWLPKKVISNVVERSDAPGLMADISKFGGNLIRESYIAKEACDGEMLNHLGYGSIR